MYPLIEDVCKNLKDYIDKERRIVGDAGIETRELSAKFTTDVVASCIFGLDAGSLKDKDAVIRKMGKKLFDINFRFIFIVLMSEICPSLHRLLRMPSCPQVRGTVLLTGHEGGGSAQTQLGLGQC